jgi:hypothetical protein
VQRYQCNECNKKFRASRRKKQTQETLWRNYTHGKQTLRELATQQEKSHVAIRNALDSHEVRASTDITPQKTVVVADTTFWGRVYGVCVFRSWNLKRNIWWHEVTSEKQAHYYYGRRILEEQGWVFVGAVVDGRRGLATVFKDIPVQVCHFHQIKTVTKYLTRKPETEAGVTLRRLVLTLPTSTEETFTKALTTWYQTWTLPQRKDLHTRNTTMVLHTPKSTKCLPLTRT